MRKYKRSDILFWSLVAMWLLVMIALGTYVLLAI